MYSSNDFDTGLRKLQVIEALFVFPEFSYQKVLLGPCLHSIISLLNTQIVKEKIPMQTCPTPPWSLHT